RLIRLSWPFLLGRIHAMPEDPVRPARTGDGPRPALSERDLVVEVAGITAAATAAAAFLGRAGLAEIRAASAALIAAAALVADLAAAALAARVEHLQLA